MKLWLITMIFLSSALEPANPWALFTEPIPTSDPQVFGYYRHGCLIGGESLPAKGIGFETVNRQRVRHFGHPEMISLITDWAQWAHETFQAKMVVGDIAQPRGGPANGGHASHQTGLDADIRFALLSAEQSIADNEGNYETPTMVKYSSKVIKKKTVYSVEFLKEQWDPRLDQLIATVASNPKVERLFFNAPIKKHLCESFKNGDGSYPFWLEKIRPETGHVYHFHVRMLCPAGSLNCIPQDSVKKDSSDPTGVGCAGKDFDYWFSQSVLKSELGNPETVPAAPALDAPSIPYWQQVMNKPAFPPQCKELLEVD